MLAGEEEPAPPHARFCSTEPLSAHYRLRSKALGTGMNGAVRLAECRRSGKRFAVKSFRKRRLSAKAWADMEREVQLHLSLDHPGIARLERVYDERENVHLVMECLEGGELFDRVVSRGSLPEAEAADIARQVLSAVAYMHSKGVVHRDLKLENLMLEQVGSRRVRLIDFGLSTRWDGETALSQTCGSLQYVAPEVLRRSYGAKADLWSLGVVLYVLLVGRPLHRGPEHVIPKRVRDGKLSFAPQFHKLSEGARDLIQALLRQNPAERPSALEALAHPWLETACEPPAAEIVQQLHNPCTQRGRLVNAAWALQSERLDYLRDQFDALDADRLGVLTLDSLRRSLGDAEAEAIFSSLGGEVSWSEFLAAALPEGEYGSFDDEPQEVVLCRPSDAWQEPEVQEPSPCSQQVPAEQEPEPVVVQVCQENLAMDRCLPVRALLHTLAAHWRAAGKLRQLQAL